MPNSASFDIEGKEKFDRALTLLNDSFKDFRRIWPQVAAVFYKAERRQFDSEGGKSGGWAAPSEPYAKAKEIRYPGQPILRATNALYESLTDPTGENAIFSQSEDTLTLGSSLDYAAVHQTGWEKMPARPPIAIDDEEQAEMVRVMREALGNNAVRLGFEITTAGF